MVHSHTGSDTERIKAYFALRLTWHCVARSVPQAYACGVNGQRWLVVPNEYPHDWPYGYFYSLIVDGQTVLQFDYWPLRWKKKGRNALHTVLLRVLDVIKSPLSRKTILENAQLEEKQ